MSRRCTGAAARSYLFAPGDKERLLTKVFTAGADAVVLDLEDGVAPGRKEEARGLLRSALHSHLPAIQVGGPAVWVRINDLRGEHWHQDLEAVVQPGLCGLRIPKAESPQQLVELDRTLTNLELGRGLDKGSLRVMPTIESAVGLLTAGDLAAAPRVERLAFGETDFAADIGAEPGLGTLWARSQLVVVSRAAGAGAPVAPVFTRLDDEAGLRKTCVEAKRLGYFGRSCIHPVQLPVVHAVFTPGTAEVARAREILRVSEASRGGSGRLAGQFVDAAVVRRAEAVVDLAGALGEEQQRDQAIRERGGC